MHARTVPIGAKTGAIGHRPDIDGLRALAILPVLLFHAHVPGFSGGYVGVDIFFVISGFLITGIIARDMDEGRFSIVDFYDRRFRRILPAFFVMMMAVLGAATWIYLPSDFEGVPRSAVAASLFASNLWFFTDTGYFAGGADAKPLLHSWSLAVEEQFYVGFPLLLTLIARRAPRARVAIVAFFAAGSLTLSIAMQRDMTGFTFYLLPARAWELLAGSLLALGAARPIASRVLRETICAVALGAIAAAVVFYNNTTPFPGLGALPPVFGAAALIHCAPGTWTGRLLSAPPSARIGLLSYSLYLWHWPLIVFVEYATDAPLAGLTRLVVLAASFACAYLSWRFIERPFRTRSRLQRRSVFALAGLSIAVTCALSLGMMATGGWPGRFAPAVLARIEGRNDISPFRKTCHDSFVRGAEPCALGAAVRPSSLLWGDSHGVELSYALSLKAREDGRAIIERTASSCPPVLGYDAPDARCSEANQATYQAILADPAIQRVYLAAFWANGDFDNPIFVAKLARTVALLRHAGRSVTIIGPVPPQPFDVPRRLAHLAQRGESAVAEGVMRAQVEAKTVHLRRLFEVLKRQGVTVIDPIAALCDATRCALETDGKPLYFDSHHLTVAGARRVVAYSAARE